MKYVCLVYLVEKDMRAMTKREADACTDESLAYDDALRKAGHLVVAHALQPVEAATTVRVRSGTLSATDGPFAETTEQLGGEDPDGPAWQHRGATDPTAPAVRRT